MKLLDIAEVTAESGVPPSALRYYEEKGLIQALARRGLRRQYGPEVLQVLSLIALGKRAGFSLEEIAQMFGPGGRPALPREDLHARAEDLRQQARQMDALAQMLDHVADCPAKDHLDCGKFQQLLRVASKARQRAARGGQL
ncbi:helix-turn-helix domain-containing protein [Phaeobacter sp. HF9A]|uniref:helix-turn-helix domain-containing protein n=1 Tax=Phaeobacter sp. HF9A TaxID=2721561 RepID=UPI00143052F4|nr:helix-turn-helix domain-containing protein [Phaeobacter sp. HF9A]NIZ13239.1 helix-turn-helix domain-containing protein [Phaeobacter sp. HF9A]